MDDEPFTYAAPVNKTAVVIIVLICLAIVSIPTLVAYAPIEKSKWLLADAKNSLERSSENSDARLSRAEQLLKQAEELNPAIATSRDYIKVYSLLYGDRLERIAELVAKQELPERNLMVEEISNQLFTRKDYAGLVRFVKTAMPNVLDRPPQLNNTWAYAASLAKIELDEALVAINEALKHEDSSPFIDTKAWVLYQQMQYDEALHLMQTAIQTSFEEKATFIEKNKLPFDKVGEEIGSYLKRLKESDPLGAIPPAQLLSELQLISEPNLAEGEEAKRLEGIRSQLAAYEPPKNENKDLAANVRELLREFSMYRFHRSEVIRALGFEEIADWEWQAIQRSGFQTPEDLE